MQELQTPASAALSAHRERFLTLRTGAGNCGVEIIRPREIVRPAAIAGLKAGVARWSRVVVAKCASAPKTLCKAGALPAI